MCGSNYKIRKSVLCPFVVDILFCLYLLLKRTCRGLQLMSLWTSSYAWFDFTLWPHLCKFWNVSIIITLLALHWIYQTTSCTYYFMDLASAERVTQLWPHYKLFKLYQDNCCGSLLYEQVSTRTHADINSQCTAGHTWWSLVTLECVMRNKRWSSAPHVTPSHKRVLSWNLHNEGKNKQSSRIIAGN